MDEPFIIARPTLLERVREEVRYRCWRIAVWRGRAPSNVELGDMQRAGELLGKWRNPKHAKRIDLHWCFDWDGMLIDKYAREHDFCTCEDGPETWLCEHGHADSDDCPDCRH